MARKIGDTLRKSRISAGISVEQISDILTQKGHKASIKTIYSWENGNSSPGPDALLEMCGIYKIDNILAAFGYDGYKEDGSLKLNLKENQIIEKYRSLDDPGRSHVDTVLDWEAKRSVQLRQAQEWIIELEAQNATVIELPHHSDAYTRLTKYFHSVSAGSGIFILGNESAEKIYIPSTPENEIVDYVIKMSGDSMEPDYHDGDNVMVSQRVDMKHGDVGIFVVNGNTHIKEYGKTELISRNPDSPNIKIAEHDNIVCMGRVVGKLEGPYKIISN